MTYPTTVSGLQKPLNGMGFVATTAYLRAVGQQMKVSNSLRKTSRELQSTEREKIGLHLGGGGAAMILSEFERGQEEEEEEEEEDGKGQAAQEELVLESPATVVVTQVGENVPLATDNGKQRQEGAEPSPLSLRIRDPNVH